MRTHSPRPSAVTSPSFLSPSRTLTRAPGAARPAITALPFGPTLTISKLGAAGDPGAGFCAAEGAEVAGAVVAAGLLPLSVIGRHHNATPPRTTRSAAPPASQTLRCMLAGIEKIPCR